ncbi:hypothetical protein YC2023_078341 [Brassica napus]|uniref:Exostosin GT47 domain-containing protein n=1 Tax=Brassica oleracea TaxID=3712 RepID=A0A3P6GT21_BRAOL|nr:unnamed protein product [Brassica oleracea]
MSALWGKLASEILMQNWDIALEELNRLKDIIDSKAPSETRKHFSKTIRALCNSDVKEGFVFGNDTSLPETYVRDPKKPLSNIGGKSASKRPTVAFFAGQPDHGYVRPILLSYWGNNKDPYLKIFGKLLRSKGNKNYLHPRVVEAIFYGCVPVIISDNLCHLSSRF